MECRLHTRRPLHDAHPPLPRNAHPPLPHPARALAHVCRPRLPGCQSLHDAARGDARTHTFHWSWRKPPFRPREPPTDAAIATLRGEHTSLHKSVTWAKRELGLAAYEQLRQASLPAIEALSPPLATKLTETLGEVARLEGEIKAKGEAIDDKKRAEVASTEEEAEGPLPLTDTTVSVSLYSATVDDVGASELGVNMVNLSERGAVQEEADDRRLLRSIEQA